MAVVTLGSCVWADAMTSLGVANQPRRLLVLLLTVVAFVLLSESCEAFSTCSPAATTTSKSRPFFDSLCASQPKNGGEAESLLPNTDDDENNRKKVIDGFQRRHVLSLLSLFTATTSLPSWAEESSMFSPKFVQQYEDFVEAKEGWSYKDVRAGSGDAVAEEGDRVVYDWSGYTIGYFGRPFQAKGGPQGGAFDKDLDYERTVVGSGRVVPGLDLAFRGMRKGQIRQVIVPFGELSYPASDLEHVQVGPKPSTFSGQRALNFVLENSRIDRTLLFNVKVIRIDKRRGSGSSSFVRGS